VELSEDCQQGALIPEECDRRLSDTWQNRRFSEARSTTQSIDMFVHDSSHSYRHMLWNFVILAAAARRRIAYVARRANELRVSRIHCGTYAHDKKPDARCAAHVAL